MQYGDYVPTIPNTSPTVTDLDSFIEAKNRMIAQQPSINYSSIDYSSIYY